MLLDNDVAFVCFRKPDDNDTTIFVFTEKDIHYLNDYNELDNFSGFIFHPFESSKKKPVLLINPEFQFSSKDSIPFIKKNILPFSSADIQKTGNSEKVISTSKNEYFDMPQLFKTIINKGYNAVSFPIHEYWLDIGHYNDFVKANNEINNNLHNE